MSKTLSKYIAALDYFDETLVLSATSSSVLVASFANITVAPVEITIVLVAWIQLKSIENKLSKTMEDNENSHEDFVTIIFEERTIVN